MAYGWQNGQMARWLMPSSTKQMPKPWLFMWCPSYQSTNTQLCVQAAIKDNTNTTLSCTLSLMSSHVNCIRILLNHHFNNINKTACHSLIPDSLDESLKVPFRKRHTNNPEHTITRETQPISCQTKLHTSIKNQIADYHMLSYCSPCSVVLLFVHISSDPHNHTLQAGYYINTVTKPCNTHGLLSRSW